MWAGHKKIKEYASLAKVFLRHDLTTVFQAKSYLMSGATLTSPTLGKCGEEALRQDTELRE